MKKLILFLILVASCFWEVNAQATFDRTLGVFGGDRPDYGQDVLQLDDCSYLVLGIASNHATTLQKVDEFGNHIWTRSYDFAGLTDFQGNSIVQTPSGDILIAGLYETDNFASYLLAVHRVDANGNCLWTKTYHNLGTAGSRYESKIINTSDGNYAITGTMLGSGAFITKIDGNGIWLWTKTYSTGTSANDITEISSGNLAVTGRYNGTYLLVTDANGGVLCENYFADNTSYAVVGKAIIETNDGHLAIAGTTGLGSSRRSFLLKTNICSSTLWAKNYLPDNTDLQAEDLVQNADDTYNLVGTARSPREIFMLKADVNGNFISSENYTETSIGYKTQLIKTRDGGYAIAGTRFETSGQFAGEALEKVAPNYDNIRLIKTDAAGGLNGCETTHTYSQTTYSPPLTPLPGIANGLTVSVSNVNITCSTPILGEDLDCVGGQPVCNSCTTDLGADQIICEGDTSWLSVAAGWTSVKWYFDEILQAGPYPNPYPLTDEGEYCISVEDASGCVATDCINVQVISSDTDTPTFMTNIMVADSTTNYDEYGYSGLENQAGKYVVLGRTVDLLPLGPTNDYAFVELDYIGNVLATPKMNGYLNPFNNEGRDETAVSMIEVINPTTLAADGYVVTGWSQAIAGGTRDMMISRLDSDGCNIWTQYIPGTVSGVSEQEYGRMVIQSSDGNFWIVGNRQSSSVLSTVLVVNVAYAGGILSAKEYDFNQNASGLALTEFSGYFPGIYGTPPFIGITGRVGSDILFMGIDGNNNAINTAWYDCGYPAVGYSIQQDNNGDVVITGNTRKLVGINLYKEPFILKLNGFPVFYPGGGTYGRIAWLKKYNLTDGGAKGTSIVVNADNEYIIAGTKDMPPSNTIAGLERGKAFLMKTDDNGNPIWANHYLATGKVGSKATQVNLTKDGGYLVTGNTWKSIISIEGGTIEVSSDYDMLALKTDSKGDVKTCNCSSPLNPTCVSVTPSFVHNESLFGADVNHDCAWAIHSCLDLNLAQDFCDQNDNDTIPPIDTMSCLYFDGDDDRMQASGTGLNAIGSGDFTFEARIRGLESGQVSHPAIFSNRGAGGGTLFFLASWSPGGPNRMLAVQLGGSNHFITFNGIYDASILDDECHHVAITREGGLLSFYIDGALIGTKTLSTIPSVTSGDLVIGGDNVSGNQFEGHISDVRIWDVARTATEIQNSSNTLLTGSEPNLVANWQLNEGSEQTVFDSSPNAHNGVLGSNSSEESTDPNWDEDCCEVQVCIDVQIYAHLEGAYDLILNEMDTTLNMRGILPGQTPISNLATPTPAGQPYNTAPWNHLGTEGIGWTDANYTADVVDWVLISFRTGTAKDTEVDKAAALLYQDGSIAFPDCCPLTTFYSSLYIVVEHRNHMGVMTPTPVDIISGTLTHDFRATDSYRNPASTGQKQLPNGTWVMVAGNADPTDSGSYDINGSDKGIWEDQNGTFYNYTASDMNLDSDVNGADKTIWLINNGTFSAVPQ